MDKVYVIIVNWNGWKDTIECLESIYRNDYPSYQVIVCDNGSNDDSLENIKRWATGKLENEVSPSNPHYSLSSPPVRKPISFIEYTREEVEAVRNLNLTDARLILIQNAANLGFAGGNNVGIRYALGRDDFSHVWLLNNDVVIKPDALSCLVRRMSEKKDAGMCGSTIPYYSAPDTVWTLGGGIYNKWLSRSHSIGNMEPLRDAASRFNVEGTMDYLAGASMLVSRAFLHEVGLLNEEYFLYYEEPDWALRGKGKFSLGYAPESIVYHKVGASTKLIDEPGISNKSSKFHAMKSHLLFTRNFFPLFIPLVFIRIIYCAIVEFLYSIAVRLKIKNLAI
jgi:GT2 family glycosyltransferase